MQMTWVEPVVDERVADEAVVASVGKVVPLVLNGRPAGYVKITAASVVDGAVTWTFRIPDGDARLHRALKPYDLRGYSVGFRGNGGVEIAAQTP